MRWSLWLALPVIGLYAPVAEAAEAGDMRGRVVDEAGSPIAGATVTVSGEAIAGARTVTTNNDGSWMVLGLPIGSHEVLVEATDHAPLRMLVTVRLDDTVTVPATLSTTSISEVVVVEAEQPVIDTTRSAISSEITNQTLQNLPIGRSFSSAVQMLPGVYGKVDTIDGSPGSTNPSVRGEGAYGNNYYIDGVSTRDPATKTVGAAVPFDAIESIKTYTDVAPAEFGQATGMMMNMVTKSGGDEHHGSVAYYFSRHLSGGQYDILDLETGEEVPTDKRKFIGHEVSITAGGPVIKEKLWYFVALDGKVGWNRFEGMEPDAERQDYLAGAGFAKLTWFATPDLTFSYQLNADGQTTKNLISSPLYSAEAQEDRKDWQLAHQFSAKWRPDPTSELEFRASYTPVNINVVPQSGDKDAPQFTNLDTGEYYNNGSNFDTNKRTRLMGQLEYTKLFSGAGDHRLKTGAEYSILRDSRELIYTGPGDGLSYTASPADGLPCTEDTNGDGLLDDCYGYTEYQNVGALGHRGQIFGFYVQDDWTVVDSLTFNVGFRLDNETLYQNSGAKVISAWMPAPRVGVAWDITNDGKTLLSAGYGRYYDLSGNSFAGWADTRSAFVFREFTNTAVTGGDDPSNYDLTWEQNPETSPLVYCTDTSLSEYSTHLIDDLGYTDEEAQAEREFAESYCDGQLKPYHMDKLAVALEREIIPSLKVSVRGIWSTTRDLPEDIDLNLDTWVIANTPAKKRDYRALEFVMTKNFSQNWGALASWTISESKGHMPGQFELSSGGQTGSNGNGVGVYLDDIDDKDTRAFLYDVGAGYLPDGLAGLGTTWDTAGYYGYLPYHSMHQVKLNGFYTFNFGTTLGLTYEYNSGRAWQKRGLVSLYGDYFAFPEGRGTRFMPAVHYIDFRIAHRQDIDGIRSVEVMFDLFNVADLKTPVTYYENDNDSFGKTLFRQAPMSFRAGLKFVY